MTRRRCESCGTDWLTFGPHDPCPYCGHGQRVELGMDTLPDPPIDWHRTHEQPDLWTGSQEEAGL